MNTTLIAACIAGFLALSLVIGLFGLSMATGTIQFFFGKPKLEILKSQNGANGFAFGFRWNNDKEPAKFDFIRLRLFNPFGKPTQVEVARSFTPHGHSFAEDINMGISLENILSAQGMEKAIVQVELRAVKDGVCHQFDMKGESFKSKIGNSTSTADHYNKKNGLSQSKVYYHQVSKSHIAPQVKKSSATLKIASNPEFAGELGSSAGTDGAIAENFTISKVWIEEGCIVCDACEGIYPEVFEVTESTCIIRDGAPLDNGLLMLEAAEACPVEVIKFKKA